MNNNYLRTVAASIGFGCSLGMNSFSLWGFTYLPAAAFGSIAQDAWIFPLELSNVLAFVMFVIIDKKKPQLAETMPFKGAVVATIASVLLVGKFVLEEGGGTVSSQRQLVLWA